MKNKQGISLLILVISIIVLSILVVVSIIGVDSAINTAKKTSFTEELLTVRENLLAKLLSKEDLGKYVEAKKYTKTDLLGMVTGDKKNLLAGNVIESTGFAFYQVKLSAFGTVSGKRGFGPDAADYFYIQLNDAKTEMKDLIYPKGVTVDGKMFFKLTQELLEGIDEEDMSANVDYPGELRGSKDALSFTKNTKEFTNRLVVSIQGNVSPLTSVSLHSVDGGIPYGKVNVVENKFILEPGTINEKISGVSMANVVCSEAKGLIDVSNLDIKAPVIHNVKVTKTMGGLEITVDAADDKSGVKNYIFTPTVKRGGQEYYKSNLTIYSNIATGTVNTVNYNKYVKNFGKRVNVGVYNLPRDTERFSVAVEDGAGNITIHDYDTKGQAVEVPPVVEGGGGSSTTNPETEAKELYTMEVYPAFANGSPVTADYKLRVTNMGSGTYVTYDMRSSGIFLLTKIEANVSYKAELLDANGKVLASTAAIATNNENVRENIYTPDSQFTVPKGFRGDLYIGSNITFENPAETKPTETFQAEIYVDFDDKTEPGTAYRLSLTNLKTGVEENHSIKAAGFSFFPSVQSDTEYKAEIYNATTGARHALVGATVRDASNVYQNIFVNGNFVIPTGFRSGSADPMYLAPKLVFKK